MDLNEYVGLNALRMDLSEKHLSALSKLQLSEKESEVIYKLIEAAEKASWNEGYDDGWRDRGDEEL